MKPVKLGIMKAVRLGYEVGFGKFAEYEVDGGSRKVRLTAAEFEHVAELLKDGKYNSVIWFLSGC